MTGCTLWFTGLPYSGKSTLANALVKELNKRKISHVLIDDTKVRNILSSDLKETKYEYFTHVIRLANFSYVISNSNVLSIVCTVAPKQSLRRYAKQLIKNFVEIHVDCPHKVCEERAHQKLNGFMSCYEYSSPHLVLNTHRNTIKENIKKLIHYLEQSDILER